MRAVTEAKCEPCPVCPSTKSREAFEIDGYLLSRCGKCKHLFASARVSQDVLDSCYTQQYFEKVYDNYLATADERIKAFEGKLGLVKRFRESQGRLLDYGCAIGLFVKVAQDLGWQATGCETSEWAAAYGRKKLGVDIRLVGKGDALFAPGSFDVVTLWDVIEHVPDPRAVVATIGGWLSSGGVLALNTVNSSSFGARLAGKQWRHLVPPMHLQYYSRRSLFTLLRSHGFRIRYASSDGVALLATQGSRPAGRLLRDLDYRVLRYWRARPLVTAANVLDEITVIATKT